ncbi:MAG: hypothetical protein AAB355_00420 [Patescibacteria group bacterium]
MKILTALSALLILLFLINTLATAEETPPENDAESEEILQAIEAKKRAEIRSTCFNLTADIIRRLDEFRGGTETSAFAIEEMAFLAPKESRGFIVKRMVNAALESYEKIKSLVVAYDASRGECSRLLEGMRANLPM